MNGLEKCRLIVLAEVLIFNYVPAYTPFSRPQTPPRSSILPIFHVLSLRFPFSSPSPPFSESEKSNQ